MTVNEDVKIVADHFARQVIVREMHDRNTMGLKPWEKYLVETYFTKSSALVLDIGCGNCYVVTSVWERVWR